MPLTYVMIFTAIVANICAVFLMKLSNGMTAPWATLGMIITNLLTVWFLGRAMAMGAPVSAAVTFLTVGVMIGSFLIGLAFGERITVIQAVGGLIAIVGVVIGNMTFGKVV